MSTTTDPTIPPVGSLWRHRVTGERRFVTSIGTTRSKKRPVLIQFVTADPIEEQWQVEFYEQDQDYPDVSMPYITLAVWLAWQANAERIDSEPATAPRGQEE